MLLTPTPTPEDRWNSLAQAAHASRIDPNFRRLLAAVDSGWQIESPVYLRPRWGEVGPRVYLFILRHAALSMPRLLSVPAGEHVDAFVRNEGMAVQGG